ncbi:hypothetical protein GY45DRAFT_98958 [Cubamyces sp. BRFM 1775]|nr:hypothetical protein GY45DRAFT_98958 [Cubamyces sp. BRFM 1775]
MPCMMTRVLDLRGRSSFPILFISQTLPCRSIRGTFVPRYYQHCKSYVYLLRGQHIFLMTLGLAIVRYPIEGLPIRAEFAIASLFTHLTPSYYKTLQIRATCDLRAYSSNELPRLAQTVGPSKEQQPRPLAQAPKDSVSTPTIKSPPPPSSVFSGSQCCPMGPARVAHCPPYAQPQPTELLVPRCQKQPERSRCLVSMAHISGMCAGALQLRLVD